ncbi:DUF7471 family protein [Salinirarus marinus]|uniref:DUF7471 family protein n=1 Tax=Salinirarus marinus TaxID=3068310 RepID=UPI003C6C4296
MSTVDGGSGVDESDARAWFDSRTRGESERMMYGEHEAVRMSLAPGVLVPGHVSGANVPLTLTLAVAGLASMVLVTAGIVALVRRRSTSYLLVAGALVLLFGRTVMAALALNGTIPDGDHHLVEHGLDVAMTSLVFGAVYFARRAEADGSDSATDRDAKANTAADGGGHRNDPVAGDGGESG